MKIAIVLEFDDNTEDVCLRIDALLDAGAIQDLIKERFNDNDATAEIVDAFCAPFTTELLEEMDE